MHTLAVEEFVLQYSRPQRGATLIWLRDSEWENLVSISSREDVLGGNSKALQDGCTRPLLVFGGGGKPPGLHPGFRSPFTSVASATIALAIFTWSLGPLKVNRGSGYQFWGDADMRNWLGSKSCM